MLIGGIGVFSDVDGPTNCWSGFAQGEDEIHTDRNDRVSEWLDHKLSMERIESAYHKSITIYRACQFPFPKSALKTYN